MNSCQLLDCSCDNEKYSPPLREIIDEKTRDIIENFDIYTADLTTKKQTIQFALENMGFTRNFSNKEFVLFYWLIFDAKNDTIARECIRYLIGIKDKLSETETIRRAKQEAVSDDPEKFGPTSEELIKAKLQKEEEYFVHYSKNTN